MIESTRKPYRCHAYPVWEKETLFENSRKQKPQNNKKKSDWKNGLRMNNSRRVLNKVLYGGAPLPPTPPRSHPISFYTPLLTEKAFLSYTFYWQMLSLSHTWSRTLHPLQLLWIHCLENMKKSQNQQIFSFLLAPLGLFSDGNDRFRYPLYTSSGGIPTLKKVRTPFVPNPPGNN